MIKTLKSVLLVVTAAALLSLDLPTGCYRAGSQPEHYEMGTDKGAGQDGSDASTIKSINKPIQGFGTLMSRCSADKYLGKRVRMSGSMKTTDVAKWAGFWLRVDQD